LSDREANGVGYREIRGSERVRADHISEDGSAREDLKVRSASIFGAESLRLLAGGGS
jgi:hypothetical protein